MFGWWDKVVVQNERAGGRTVVRVGLLSPLSSALLEIPHRQNRRDRLDQCLEQAELCGGLSCSLCRGF